MAIPSASGTEVFKTVLLAGSSTDTTLFTVPAHHIYTVISVIVTNKYGSDASGVNMFNLTVSYSSTDYTLLHDQHLPYKGTYIWSERTVIMAAGLLKVNGTQNIDVWCSFLDQNWE